MKSSDFDLSEDSLLVPPVSRDKIHSSSIETKTNEDKIIEKEPLYYKKVKDRNVLKHDYRLALGIDPSQTGSGFALYDNRKGQEKLHLMSAKLPKVPNLIKDPLGYSEMRSNFRKALMKVFSSIPDGFRDTYDLIIIEDTVMNHSPDIFKRLVLINYVIDDMIAEGVVKTKLFIRVNNNKWKKYLNTYKAGKQYLKVKQQIESILLTLEEPYALENHTKDNAWKKREHYQDKLDALSMILVGRDIEKENSTKGTKRKIKYRYEVVKDITQYQDKYSEIVLEKQNSQSLKDTINLIRTDIRRHKYYIKVNNSILGNFGIQHNLIMTTDQGYLLIY